MSRFRDHLTPRGFWRAAPGRSVLGQAREPCPESSLSCTQTETTACGQRPCRPRSALAIPGVKLQVSQAISSSRKTSGADRGQRSPCPAYNRRILTIGFQTRNTNWTNGRDRPAAIVSSSPPVRSPVRRSPGCALGRRRGESHRGPGPSPSAVRSIARHLATYTDLVRPRRCR